MKDFIMNFPYTGRVFLGFIFGMLAASLSIPLGWGPLNVVYSLWPALVAMLFMLYFVIRWEAILDAEKIEDGRKIQHFASAVLRGAGIVGVSAVINAHFWHWSAVLTLSLFGMLFYWALFNYHLNLERKLPAFYLPKEDRDGGSTIDQFFNNFKHGGEIIAILCVLGMLLTGYVYLKQY